MDNGLHVPYTQTMHASNPILINYFDKIESFIATNYNTKIPRLWSKSDVIMEMLESESELIKNTTGSNFDHHYNPQEMMHRKWKDVHFLTTVLPVSFLLLLQFFIFS